MCSALEMIGPSIAAGGRSIRRKNSGIGWACAAWIGVFGIAGSGAVSVAAAQESPDWFAGEWKFQLSPYAWAAGLKGKVGTRPGLPVAKVDAGFDDILENLDVAFMMLGEARHGRFGLVADIAYLSLSAEADTPGPLFGKAKLKSDTLFATVAGAYRVFERDNHFLDVLAGGRVWDIDNDFKLTAGLLPEVKTGSGETWVDPIVGVRGHLDLGSGFTVAAYADIGGFGAASDLTWQLYGGIQYSISNWFAATAGYRHLSVDYRQDGFVWDVELSGPMLGVTIRF
jgi:hypothetical protein